MPSTVCGVKIQSGLRLLIPEDCNQIATYNDLKRDLQELYTGATWFQVCFSGPWNTENSGIWPLNWILAATWLSEISDQTSKNNSKELPKSLGAYAISTFRTMVQQNKKLLQIEEDNAPFAEANHHSWTLDGIPESCDVNMDAAGRCLLSMPTPHPLGFPEVDVSSMFDHMDAKMAGWSVPARSGPPAVAGGAAAALAQRVWPRVVFGRHSLRRLRLRRLRAGRPVRWQPQRRPPRPPPAPAAGPPAGKATSSDLGTENSLQEKNGHAAQTQKFNLIVSMLMHILLQALLYLHR